MAQHFRLGIGVLFVVSIALHGVVGVDAAHAEKLSWTDLWSWSSSGSHFGKDLDDDSDYWRDSNYGRDKNTYESPWGDKHGTDLFGKLHKLGDFLGHSSYETPKKDHWLDAFKERFLKGHDSRDGHDWLRRLKKLIHYHKDDHHYEKAPEPSSFYLAVLGGLAAVFYAWRCRREPRLAQSAAHRDVALR